MGEAEEERIAVVQTGGDEAVKYGGGVGGEGGAESVYVAEMEICSAGNGVDVRVEGMVREKVLTLGSVDLVPRRSISVLLQFNLRKFEVNQVFYFRETVGEGGGWE